MISPFSKLAEFESPFTQFVNLGGQLFKRVLEFPDYFVSEYGLVYSIWWKKIMIVNPDKDGYYFIRLAYGNSKKKNIRISRLVYETFTGTILNDLVIDHYDGNIHNNHITNLNAISSDDNTLKGHTFDMKKDIFSNDLIVAICEGIQSGKSLEEIFANKYIGVNFSTLQSFTNFCLGLIRGFYYRNITSQYDLRNFHYSGSDIRKYQSSQIEDICKLIESGLPKGEISSRLGIPMSTIKNVYNRSSWKEISEKICILN